MSDQRDYGDETPPTDSPTVAAAPQRIWLLDWPDVSATWCVDPDPDGEHHDSIEYVRADLALAQGEADRARVVELERLSERLKLEAQMHSGEARAHKATVHESYQIATGATGEPGNWHGAEPVRALADRALAAEAKLAEAIEVVKPFAQALADWGDDRTGGGNFDIWEHPVAMNINLGHLRMAAAFIAPAKTEVA